MDLLEKIKQDRMEARKGTSPYDKLRASLLTTLVGEAETALKGKQAKSFDMVKLVKKFYLGCEERLKVRFDKDTETEMLILDLYLPVQMTEDQIKAFLSPLVLSDKDVTLGMIMGYFAKNFKGQYDGKLVSTLAKEALANK